MTPPGNHIKSMILINLLFFADILSKARQNFEKVQAVNKVKEVLLCMVTIL